MWEQLPKAVLGDSFPGRGAVTVVQVPPRKEARNSTEAHPAGVWRWGGRLTGGDGCEIVLSLGVG